LLLPILAFAACSEQPPPVARNVIVISVDTLRADRLGCYGHELPTSPNIDALAREGVVFDDASSTSAWTLPAHASLLVGRYPTRHGVRALGEALPRDLPTLASMLRVHGFATGAVVNLLALQTHQLLSGFESVEMLESDQSAEGAAASVTRLATMWLERQQDKRTLLFLHYYDVHSDYRSLPHYEGLFTERTNHHQGSTDQVLSIAATGRVQKSEAERLSRLYDAGVRQLDDELGRFFRWLEEQGRLENTLVVLTSDHGEEFFDHGPEHPARTIGVSHGHSLYQELVRIPLIMRGPSVPRGIRVEAPVSLVDVTTTVLGALGLRAPSGLDGMDLRPLFEKEAAIERPLFIATSGSRGKSSLEGVRRGQHKLVVDVETGRRELYDLEKDPGESVDLSAEHPEIVELLGEDLSWMRAQRREGEVRRLSEEEKERLRALGYL
jgi:arylsulfatase A-like enzyme